MKRQAPSAETHAPTPPETHRCRWCTKPMPRHDFAGMAECRACGAQQHALVFSCSSSTPQHIALYLNPDNSLFVEFVGHHNGTARYTLSAELLRQTGMLQEFAADPQGRREVCGG